MTQTERFHSQLYFECRLIESATRSGNGAVLGAYGIGDLDKLRFRDAAEDMIEDKYLYFRDVAIKIKRAYPDWCDRRFSDRELEEYQALYTDDSDKERVRHTMNLANFWLRRDDNSWLFPLAEQIIAGCQSKVAMELDDYIADHFKSQSDFAKKQGVKRPQVTQWVGKEFIVVGSEMYSHRRSLNLE